jgi:hypothetical protein
MDPELSSLRTLEQVLAWSRSKSPPYRVAEIVTQDEYTHDVVIAAGESYLVFDTT